MRADCRCENVVFVFCLFVCRYQIPFIGGVKYRGWEKWRFSTDIAVYLRNDARQADGHYGTLIGSHGCRIEWQAIIFDDFERPLTGVSRSLYTYKSNISQMVREFSIVQSRIVDNQGLYRNRAKNLGSSLKFFFANSAGRCFTSVIENIKPNTFCPH